MKCIFCGIENSDIDSEHIIPASFAGENSPQLELGSVCKKCNNYFSHSFENYALNDFPFNVIALLWGIKNRKGKLKKVHTEYGDLEFGEQIGKVGIYTEIDLIKELPNINMTLNPNPKNAEYVCRLVCKIAYEYLYYHFSELTIDKNYKDIRKLIRFPNIGMTWSFSISGHDNFINNILNKHSLKPFDLSLIGDKTTPLAFSLSIMDLIISVPLTRERINCKEIYEKNYANYFIIINRKNDKKFGLTHASTL